MPATTDPYKLRRVKLLATLLGLIGIYLLGAYSGFLQGRILSWWSDLFWTLAAFAAAWRSLLTANTRALRHERIAWTLFACAAFSWFLGMLIWDYDEVFGGTLVPFPSMADWFFVGYALCFTVGLLHFRTQTPSRRFDMIPIANLGLIICTSIVLCTIILSQALAQSSNTLTYKLYALTHTISTNACIVFGIYCYWFYVWRENRRSIQILLVALLIMACANTLYAFQLLGQAFDAASYLNVYWLLCFALQYWAAFEQDILTETPTEKIDSSGSVHAQRYEAIMPALCLLTVLVFIIMFREQLDETAFTVMIVAAMAFALFLTLREWSANTLELNLLHQIQTANALLEARVSQRTAELSNAVGELEAFCYSVSHDLRAPLRGIKGFGQLLLEDYALSLDPTGRDYLQRMCNGTQKMSDIIDALLDLSRVSRHTLQKKTVNLQLLAEDTIKQLRELDPGRQVQVTIGQGIVAQGDEHLLRIALENLLGNAWKYTNKKTDAKIEFGVKQQDSETVYFIKDNGAGYDMKYAERIFNAFQRLHGQEFEGTGIGLATVARCIRRHHGRIWGEAEVLHGATFFFTLPATQWAQAEIV